MYIQGFKDLLWFIIIYLLVKDTEKLPKKVVTSNYNKVRSTLGGVESTLDFWRQKSSTETFHGARGSESVNGKTDGEGLHWQRLGER